MSTYSLPSQAFHGSWARDLLAPLGSLFARWARPAEQWPAGDDAGRAARRLRDFANGLRERDPRMAAELMAAADRHERLHEQ